MSEQELAGLELIISSLSSLQLRLQKSGFERTAGLRRAMGSDCPYYLKSLGHFQKNDLSDLRDLVQTLGSQIESLERL